MSCYHYFYILAFLSLPLIVNGQSSFQELKEKAHTAYEQQNYQEALAEWKELRGEGNSDPALLYNIGLAESKNGNIPEALLNFEKALRYKPADEQIQSAIQQERNKIENSVIPVKPFFLVEWYNIMLALFRPGIWAFLALIIMLFGILQWFIAIGIIKSRKPKIKVNIWIILVTGIFFLLLSFLSYQQIHRINEGIVFSDCALHQGASIQSPKTRVLPGGEKVKVEDEIAGWYKVKLLNLDEGWLKKECLKKIDVDERN